MNAIVTGGVGTAQPARMSARDRLLEAANDLFYAEGVHTVGIDRVIERAGVAKATLYNTFGSKDELVEAYLRSRHARIADRITRSVERHQDPRERLLAVFEAQGEIFAEPDYHGCAFANATAENPNGPATGAAAEYRRWVRALFTDLASEAGFAEPQDLARQLHALYDGASVSARMDRDGRAAATARSMAAAILDAAS